MDKLKLFCDVDGVLYAQYGGEWQIRPYSATLLNWAAKRWDVFYISYNSRKAQVVETLYLPGTVCDYDMRMAVRNYQFDKLDTIVSLTKDLSEPWLMIEDYAPTKNEWEYLEGKGQLWRWLVVPECGADVLLDLRLMLEKFESEGKIHYPRGWRDDTSTCSSQELLDGWVDGYSGPKTWRKSI